MDGVVIFLVGSAFLFCVYRVGYLMGLDVGRHDAMTMIEKLWEIEHGKAQEMGRRNDNDTDKSPQDS